VSELPTWVGSVPSPDRFATLREAARDWLTERGLPTKKTESFRSTSVRELIETDYRVATGDADTASVLKRLGQDDTYRVIVGNGAPMLTGSTRDGVRVLSLDDAIESYGESLDRVLGRSVPNEYFAAANTVAFDDAVVIVVPASVKAEVTVHLVHAISATAENAMANPRVVVLAESGSSLSLVESYLGDTSDLAFVNAVVEIDVGANASVDHVVSGESKGRTISAIGVTLADDSTYRCRSALVGGSLTRFDHFVTLVGAHASVDLAGVVFARGTEHVDHHVRIDHRGARGTSKQKFRGLADDHGTAVFDGIVRVHAGAPSCVVAQESKNLLLSADAIVHAKPHLEIDIDEVVASHGTTVGSFDRDQLFYLRTRGIDDAHARALLTAAFVRTVLDDVTVGSVKKRVLKNVLSRTPGGAEALEGDDTL